MVNLVAYTICRMCLDSNPEKGPTSRLALIALGSNLGDSGSCFDWAVSRIRSGIAHKSIRVSSYLRSTPEDCPPGSPEFLNAVVALEWLPESDDLLAEAHNLLDFLQTLERESGRVPKRVMNEPRPLDLDIIYIEGLTCRSEKLTLPHPRAAQRVFVIEPLKEIINDPIGIYLPGAE
jgi:2-amino-4-hydroxy-6-hydroxymethyldihydropteridine diphosphokinase